MKFEFLALCAAHIFCMNSYWKVFEFLHEQLRVWNEIQAPDPLCGMAFAVLMTTNIAKALVISAKAIRPQLICLIAVSFRRCSGM